MTLSLDVKRHVLLIVAGLIVAHVRRVLQYHQYSWDSGWQFVSWWLMHYLGVALLIGIIYASIKATERFFFGDGQFKKDLGIDEAIVYLSIAVIVASTAVFVLAHWVLVDGEE